VGRLNRRCQVQSQLSEPGVTPKYTSSVKRLQYPPGLHWIVVSGVFVRGSQCVRETLGRIPNLPHPIKSNPMEQMENRVWVLWGPFGPGFLEPVPDRTTRDLSRSECGGTGSQNVRSVGHRENQPCPFFQIRSNFIRSVFVSEIRRS